MITGSGRFFSEGNEFASFLWRKLNNFRNKSISYFLIYNYIYLDVNGYLHLLLFRIPYFLLLWCLIGFAIPIGLLTSITLPCYHQGKFIGVVGTDISMADLLSEVTYFQRGQRSYAWMADSSGRTMMHPLLPAPSDAYGDPVFMYITALEQEPEFKEIFNSIKL